MFKDKNYHKHVLFCAYLPFTNNKRFEIHKPDFTETLEKYPISTPVPSISIILCQSRLPSVISPSHPPHPPGTPSPSKKKRKQDRTECRKGFAKDSLTVAWFPWCSCASFQSHSPVVGSTTMLPTVQIHDAFVVRGRTGNGAEAVPFACQRLPPTYNTSSHGMHRPHHLRC